MNTGRKFLFACIGVLIGLGVLEAGARVVELICPPAVETPARPGWQTTFFASLFDWHEPDPDLLWRFRPNLNTPLIQTNRDHIIGPELLAKRADVYRILVLGDSSPAGLGLTSRDQTFAIRLQRQLSLALPDGPKTEIINASVPGYSSEQTRHYLEMHGADINPDAIVLYCGNNDASISGAHDDRYLLSHQRLVTFRRALAHLALYRTLRSLLNQPHDITPDADELVVRVSPSQYRENLMAVADYCRQSSRDLYLCLPPVPLLWPAGLQFRVFRPVTDTAGRTLLPAPMAELLGRDLHYCLSPARFKMLYGDGDQITRAVYASAPRDDISPDSAVAVYRNEVGESPGRIAAWNNLGVAWWRNDQPDSALACIAIADSLCRLTVSDTNRPDLRAARSPFFYNLGICVLSRGPDSLATVIAPTMAAYPYLDSALQSDYYSLRIKREYIEVIRDIARQYDFPVVDLPALFARSGGELLFVDHCHPTEQGHQLIAHELCRLMAPSVKVGR